MDLRVFIWVKFSDILEGGVSQTEEESEWSKMDHEEKG